MKTYYLRIEGVNMANFVYDTADLSTVRGGGLLLLEAPGYVCDKLKNAVDFFEPIMEGASLGLFRFQAEDDKAASTVAHDIRKNLQSDPNYRHATIMVEVLPRPDQLGYAERREELIALGRWRQMQSLSIVVPDIGPEIQRLPLIRRGDKDQRIPVCEFDHVRPAIVETEKKGSDLFAISKSASVRRKYGKGGKSKEWYEKITGLQLKHDFVKDFDQLTKSKGKEKEGQEAEGLNQKMAVIYLDGNRFGSRQSSYCTDEVKQKKFDQKIRKEYQNGALKTLLEEIENHAEAYDWLYRDKAAAKAADEAEMKGKLRLETLLWGGDELIWVAPAWNGWWLLGRFFQIANNWKFFDNSTLTLSAGLVFCHHNAPIRRIVHLAKTLGDLAKGDRSANRVAYQVLESFDHAGVDIAEFRKSRCPEGVDSADLILDGNAMLDMIETIKTLKTLIPKRKLHRQVEDIYRGKAAAKLQSDLYEAIDKKSLDQIKKGFGKEPACWLHLLELWDFIGMEKANQ